MMLRSFALALALTAIATPALAEDFTFVVPVDVRSLPPEITNMTVACAVETAAGGGLVGSGERDVPITAGAYHGDVTILFNATPGLSASAGTTYFCRIQKLTTAARHFYYPSDARTFIPLAPGATYRFLTPETPLH